MKILINLLCIVLLYSCNLLAQSPGLFNYQGLALDNSGNPVISQDIKLEISVLDNGPQGIVLYTEQHQTSSSDAGIFNIRIGDGMPIQGDFKSIDWTLGQKWLSTSIDINNAGYKFLGATQLLSVPYAMHAETVTNADDADADPNNEIQSLSINGDQLSLSGSNSITLPTGTGGLDEDPNNELQSLSKNGNLIELSQGGGSVVDEVNDADADPGNELQTLQLIGQNLEISNGNNINLGSIASPWKEVMSIDPGIYYDQGQVIVTNHQEQIVINPFELFGNSLDHTKNFQLDPHGIFFADDNNPLFSLMNNEENNFVDLASGQLTVQNHVGLGIYAPECQTELQNGILAMQDTLGLANTFYSKDSLYLFGSAGGLSFPDVAVLKPYQLSFETIGNGVKTTLGAGALYHVTDNFKSSLFSNELSIEETTQDLAFHRVKLNGDGLSIWNSAKWLTSNIQSDNVFGGSIQLHNPSGTPLVHLGANPDTLFGNVPTGNLLLNDSQGEIRSTLGVYNGMGFSLVEDDNSYVYSGQGNVVVGRLENGDIDVLDGKGELGYNKLSNSGYLKLHGSQNTHVSAGVEQDNGFIHLGDANGDYKAGASVDENGEGHVYVKTDGRFSILNDQQNDLVNINKHSIGYFNDSGNAAFILGRDFINANVGYQYLYGKNGYANVYLGQDYNAGGDDQGTIGLVELFDASANRRAWMDGFGSFGGSKLIVQDINQLAKINLGTVFFDNSSYADFYGANDLLNVSIHGQTSGNHGSVSVSDGAGFARAGMYVDEFDGQGYLFADVKNFRMMHPENPEKEIWYASLEGPEAAAYVRGSSNLVNGESFVPFPDHYKLVCNPETITIQLTPRHWDTFGLAVTEVNGEGFYVKELKGGHGNFEFDWHVTGIRNGFENYHVTRDHAEMVEKFQRKLSQTH